MSDRTLIRLARSMSLVGAATGIGAFITLTVMTAGTDLFTGNVVSEGAPLALFAMFFGLVVWFVIPRQPRNPLVWILTVTALACGLYDLSWLVAASMGGPELVLAHADFAPVDIPRPAAWLMFFAVPLGTGAVITMTSFGFLLFPDGRLPSPKWRWAAALSSLAVATVVISTAQGFIPTSRGAASPDGLLNYIASILLVAAALASLAALTGRFRRSSGETRQQFKWVLWGAAVLVVSLILLLPAQGTAYESVSLVLFALAGAIFVVAYGIALGKYRLFDVDVVISRTFVYGTLAVFITVVYVVAVVGAGRLLDLGDQPNNGLAILATTLVAVAFQPLRRRLERVANRMVYGRRATPYEVLSTFSRRVAAVDPDVLTQIAQALEEGTTARAASVWMRRGALVQPIAVWPATFDLPDQPSGATGGLIEKMAPVIHDGEELGLVMLLLEPGQAFSPVDQRLLEQVAGGLGLALRNLKLTEDLKTRVAQLRESRRRIVAVQDMTRHRLERDLHDGAQQRLVALKIKLGIGATMAEKAGLEQIDDLLVSLRGEADDAVNSVRDFARGIYPPLLEAEGLPSALAARVEKAPLPVALEANGVGRYTREVEATVYFCVLEAVQNALKHSRAEMVRVSVDDDGGEISFEVSDDGLGFDPDSTGTGSGLANLADRVDALDGSLQVISRPGDGTTIRGRIPLREMAGIS
ncbi:MAG: GAF domain-containing sensor histidine kinase [Acidimicrobiia bacterium]